MLKTLLSSWTVRGTSCGFNNMKADTPSSPPSLGRGDEEHRTDEDRRRGDESKARAGDAILDHSHGLECTASTLDEERYSMSYRRPHASAVLSDSLRASGICTRAESMEGKCILELKPLMWEVRRIFSGFLVLRGSY